MKNQAQRNDAAIFEELTIPSIFDHYLDENLLQSQDEEDLVLAALAILEEDDRQSRGFVIADEEEQQQEIRGAAIAGGFAGLALLGPMGALAAAGSVALAAAKGQGLAGDMARDVGHTVLAVSDRIASSVGVQSPKKLG